MSLLALRSLSRRYAGLVAVDDFDLDVPDADVHAVIGPNGAGKATLFNLISGAVTPSAGSITFAGRDIPRLRPDARAALGLARTFQNLRVFGAMTVLENVLTGLHPLLSASLPSILLRLGGARREERQAVARAREALALVGLDGAPTYALLRSHTARGGAWRSQGPSAARLEGGTGMLEVSGLAVTYGRSEAVHGVDFSVAAGETVCVLGANGAGKTTILRALCGLVRAHRGGVRLDGIDIMGRRPHWVTAHGMVQVPEGRQGFATLTVADNLVLGGWCVRSRADQARRRDSVLIRFPRLRERLHQVAGSLSGGEQQMLAIGRALMAAPRVLLLDEPSMGLAPRFVEEVFSTIAQLRGESVTILLVEQNASAALEIADRACVLEAGRIALTGPAAQVANDPAVMAAYLGA